MSYTPKLTDLGAYLLSHSFERAGSFLFVDITLAKSVLRRSDPMWLLLVKTYHGMCV
jgi:hypothetical protein